MDEKYLQSLHSQLGGEGVFGKYEDFKNLIIRDPQYAKNFYNNFGRDVLGEENDFYSLVKKKDTGVSPSAPLAEGGSSESQPMVSPGQPVPSVTKVNNPSTYNKNIEFRDWQAHQELTRSLLKSAQKNDSAGIRNAQLQLERLRASNPNIASDPSLNEDLKIANKAIKAAPDKPTVSQLLRLY